MRQLLFKDDFLNFENVNNNNEKKSINLLENLHNFQGKKKIRKSSLKYYKLKISYNYYENLRKLKKMIKNYRKRKIFFLKKTKEMKKGNNNKVYLKVNNDNEYYPFYLKEGMGNSRGKNIISLLNRMLLILGFFVM